MKLHFYRASEQNGRNFKLKDIKDQKKSQDNSRIGKLDQFLSQQIKQSSNFTLQIRKLYYYLQSKQKEKCLNRVKSSVNKISKEQVISLRAITSYFEKLFHVIKLTMDVTTYLFEKKKKTKQNIHLAKTPDPPKLQQKCSKSYCMGNRSFWHIQTYGLIMPSLTGTFPLIKMNQQSKRRAALKVPLWWLLKSYGQQKTNKLPTIVETPKLLSFFHRQSTPFNVCISLEKPTKQS